MGEDDGKLIEEIVENTLKELINTSSSKANGLVGMDSHIAEMNSRLCLQVNDVRVVGIWGMGGLGKTTIARAVYDEIACQFEHSCFLDNVKEAFISKREVQMQVDLIFRLLKEKVQSVDLDRGRKMIMERLGMKKVIVVLDDVETFSQIEALLGKLHAFGEGSRVIVTTRNKQSLSGVNETYKPTYLSDVEALELFTKYAFRTNQPNGDYDHLSRRAIEYAQGLPLALKVLGAFLDDKDVCEWEAVLEKLKKIPHIEIQDVLRTSFDGLDHIEKEIFLDIACLFRKWNKDFVTEFLDSCGFFPRNGLRVLADRALINISKDDDLTMHDLLQEMGREIVRLESPKEPGKRSRLWSYDDVSRVLTQNTATDAVECLILDLSNSKVNLCIHTGAFVGMTKLRLLIIYYSFFNICDSFDYDYDYDYDCDEGYFEYVKSSEDFGMDVCWKEDFCPVDGCKQLWRGDLKCLSHELRFLLWHGCPLKSLPSTFIPKNLVRLDMRGSHIKQLWEGIQPLQNLKIIKLSHCQYLVEIPDLIEAINLQKLFLDGCSSLFEVHSSISALQNLHFLDLKGCKQLKILPSCIHMKSLRILRLSGCSNLEKFPEISEVMMKLKWLYLDGTAIKELPSSINNLTGIVTLDLKGCTELKTLPISILMSSLRIFNLDGCSNLEKFPEISGIMKELPELCLDGTAIKGLPSSIDQLEGLKHLSMRDCESLEFLPDSICNLADLKHLDLTGCTELKTLPTSIHMRSLQTLNLDGCSNLEKFPEISGFMKELVVLGLDETAIKGLPSSIDLLVGLKHLTMRNCKSLVSLPDSICNLADLTLLHLSGCSALHNLPEKLGDLESLEDLDVDDSGVKQLPFSILRVRSVLSCIGCKEMTAPFSAWPSSVEEYCSYSVLLHLDLSDCNLLELSDGIAHLSSLVTLKLCRNNLESLPVTMNQLGWLTHLELEACKRLKSIPELSSSINYIDAHDCTALETVSTPKTRNLDFRFSNCFRLVQANLFRDIVETHSLRQDNHLRPLCFNMCLPGSEVPEWFNLRDTGCSVTFHVPLNSFNSKLLGFAICIVINFSGARHDVSKMYGRCNWTSKGNWGEQYFFQLDLVGQQYRTHRFLESDHMFMGYMSWSEYGWIAKHRLDAFTIGVETGTYFPTHGCFTSSCGVRLVYANHEEMGNSVTQPLIPVDSREGGVDGQRMEDAVQQGEDSCAKGGVSGLGAPFFPNQLEIRESETEWEAESSESGEGRGRYQTLEMLLEPQMEGKKEEIMVVVEQGEGCQVLGSAFSLRKRETEREGDKVTRVSDDGEISELGSHSGLVVPNSQSEGKEEKELIGDESLAGRGLLGPLCSCFYWLGEVWRGKREVAEAAEFGLHERKKE
ncbi:putative winged helix-turn-helix DNA-binding domain, leucine-rich repeat domain, L [Rosa chinensis]|uniref:ADP-ribosyl cyclase/cyclic ADP-ribose hydrolase n=1 Tax=Rosa chinensis TaxID=74649 RepID=A0A2P6SMT2_ROSCH|nr:putative winged helix-turn-helix DNA-binding domain, leucine-rich repeat domain, L [Rosa chinensis]